MKAIAIIPARYQSSRFEGKPLALIKGKPMIQHVCERSGQCPELDDVYVATDDMRIFKCVDGFGGKVIMTGKGHRSGTDRIAEAAEKIDLADKDIVVNIQGDQPLFHPSLLSLLIGRLKEDPIIPMCTLMHRIKNDRELYDPNHVKVVVDGKGYALYFSRSVIPFYRDQVLNRAHYKHIGIYAYRKNFLLTFTRLPYGILEEAEKLEQLRALEHGFRIKVTETLFDSTEVDTPEDIAIIEQLLSQ